MKGKVKWTHLTIALAGIVTVAIAAPALGGPSLKKLVKKEVAKQLAGRTGPAGVPGPQGPPGPAGPAGPGNVRSFSFRTDADITQEVFSGGGLTLEADCSAGDVLSVTAENSVDNSTIYSSSIDAPTGTVVNETMNQDFDSTDTNPLLGVDSSDVIGHTSFVAGATGAVVDLVWSASNPSSNLDCAFAGHAMVGD